jgi:uncharacterized protein YjdB
VTNCISAENTGSGYYDLEYYIGDDPDLYYRTNSRVYNNAAFRCGYGFSESTIYSNQNKPFYLSVYKNNISYQNDHIGELGAYGPYPESHNTWDPTPTHGVPFNVMTDTVTLTDSDFLSLDVTELSGSRKADGSLPDINFLKLASTSDLIDAGVDVGLPYNGEAPDIGYYEYTLPVTNITVTGAGGSTTINSDNGTLQLTATVTPSDAIDQTVTWSVTTGTGQATISSTGLVTAVSNGTVTARATANDGSGVYGELDITISNQVFIPVTYITVTGAGGSTAINTNRGTLQLTATISPGNADNQTVTWSVVNGTGRAAINSTGLVTALANGTVTARATANDGSGVYGNLVISISNQEIPVESIEVTGAGGAATITTDNGTLQLSASVLPVNATNNTVTWSLSNGTGEATINSAGLVTAVSDGIVTARATANDGSGVYGNLVIGISNQEIPQENHPPDITDQAFDVYESDSQDDFIGTIHAYDSDEEQILSFTIESGNESGLFSIEANTGNLYFSSLPVDFYSADFYDLSVKVTDNGQEELSDMAIVRINLIPSSEVYYIDPDNVQDAGMDGSIDHPYDSWSKVSWEEGAVYLQKRGSVCMEESSIGIAADNVVIGAYGSGDTPEIISQSDKYAIHLTNQTDITIRNITIRAENALSCLYFLGGQSDNISIEHCTFESPEYGIRIINGGSYYISKNTIKNAANAVFLIADFAEVSYNNFSSNQKAINLISSSGDARIFNNVFYDNNKAIVADEAQTLIYNNIFYFTDVTHSAIEHALANCYSDYNIFYPEQPGFVRLSGTSYATVTELNQVAAMEDNSLVKDPMWKDRFQNDYEILEGSPAIDAGIYIGPLEDMYGTKVPVGIAPDIGSFEKKNVLSERIAAETQEEDGILIYPNPATDYLIVKNQGTNSSFYRIEILDFSGRVLVQEELDAFDAGSETRIYLDRLLKGLYWLKLYNDNGKPVIKKILID